MVPPEDVELFEESRRARMRLRMLALALFNIAVWSSHALLYEDFIFLEPGYGPLYRLAQLAHCVGLLWLAARRRSIESLELGAVAMLVSIAPIHGLVMLVVRDEVLVPFLITMEWSQPVVVLALVMSLRAAVLVLGATWLVGVGVVLLRPGYDADLSDHAVLALAYFAVLASVRGHDRLRAQEFLGRRELEAANRALAQADTARTRLFTNLSHDLRTPLTLIRGEVHTLQRTSTETERAALRRIEQHSGDVTRLADELLEVARLDAGRVMPHPAALDLGEFAARFATRFAGGAPERVDTTALADETGTLVARCDPGHVTRILANLIGNATRQLERGASRVWLRGGVDGQYVTLDVCNDGPPIARERRERLFERFVSFDAEGGVASGIGLPIARELAELNLGTLQLLDDDQTVFRLRLPFTEEPPAIAPERFTLGSVAGEAGPGGGDAPLPARERSALVVEDHTELRALLAELLEAHFDVIAVADVASARRALSERAPDVILSDVMLPDGDGRDLLAYVQERFSELDVPVLLVSAVSDEPSRIAALEAGAADFIVKPFAAGELLARVDGACERARGRRRALAEQREQFLGELHDGVNSALARAALLLESASDEGPPAVHRAQIIEHARRAVRDALEESRALVTARHLGDAVAWPDAALGIEALLRESAAPFDLTLTFDEYSDGSVSALSFAQHHALARLAMEAVTNAVRYGGSESCEAALTSEGGSVGLRVASAERVTAPVAGGTGFGLRAAARRFERLGGRLTAGADADGVFRVVGSLPVVTPRLDTAA